MNQSYLTFIRSSNLVKAVPVIFFKRGVVQNQCNKLHVLKQSVYWDNFQLFFKTKKQIIFTLNLQFWFKFKLNKKNYNFFLSSFHYEYIQIKNLLYNSLLQLYLRIRLIGLGYYVFLIDHPIKIIIEFKLGYAHKLFLEVPKSICLENFHKQKMVFSSYNKSLLYNFGFNVQRFAQPSFYKKLGIYLNNYYPKLKKINKTFY